MSQNNISQEFYNIKKGGYFQVEKKNCFVTWMEENCLLPKHEELKLAVKKLKKEQE